MNIDYTGKSVLVTGGAGFIGSHLADEFVRRGASVTVVDDLSTGNENNLAAVRDRIDFRKFCLVRDDLRPLLAEKNFKIIVHTAANANIPASVEKPRTDFEKNVIGTLNLLEAVRDTRPETQIIHSSSAAVYGRGTDLLTTEDSPTVPVSPYGVSKLASENYVSVFAQLYNLQTTILRLFPVYGERLRKQVIYDLMHKIHKNPHKLEIQGDGRQVRDLNYIANVVEAYFTVAEKGKFTGEIYNAAAEETLTIDELARMICKRMKVAPRFVYSETARPGDMQRLSGDISRLKNLGYRPRVNFADGLDKTVKWFQEEMIENSSKARL